MANSVMPVVLIVEDDTLTQKNYAAALEGKAFIIAAESVAEAVEHFCSNTDISLIVMDGELGGDPEAGSRLTMQFRRRFKGPIIAASSSKDSRQEMVDVGCSHECAKGDVPQKIMELLG